MGTLVNGIKEIFATAKNTGSNVMLCGNDGTPDGHMTMENLVATLGGGSDEELTDANVLRPFRFVYITSPSTNCPNNQNGYIYTFRRMVRSDDGYYQQFFFVYNGGINKGMWYRQCVAGTWSSWEKISTDVPSFYKNYNDLSSLSSAIGGLMYIGNREDANVIGTYFTSTASMNNKHFPVDGSYWTLISIGDTSIKLCFQIAFSPNGDAYFRCYWNGWKSWLILS